MADSSASAVLARGSQRASYSCAECARRKIRCDKQIPCKPCTLRGAAEYCQRASSTTTDGAKAATRFAAGGDVASAILRLERRVAELERRDGASASSPSSHHLHRRDISSTSVLSPGYLDASTTDSPTSPGSILAGGIAGGGDVAAADTTNVDQAVTYEYLALGKDRNRGILGPPTRHLHTETAPSSNILTKRRQTPLDASISQALLSSKSLDYVLTFADDVVAWQHACVHWPTFQQQVSSFLQLPQDQRWSFVDPLWLALFFVIQSIAVHQMNPNDSSTMSILAIQTPQQQSALTAKLLDAALKSFEAGRYLFEPSFFTCQAIAILCVCGHNVTDSNLLSSLLAIGIKTAQTLNLHVLGGEDTRMRGIAETAEENEDMGNPASSAWKDRVVALEMAKRIWWSLVQQDYLAIPFRGVSLVHPRDHDTPIPTNLDDEDLSNGRLISRPENELTLVSKLRFTSRTADVVCHFFQTLPRNRAEGTASLKAHVDPYEAKLMAMLPHRGPGQLRTLNPTFQFGAALRRYLNVSLRHKVLVLHRAFCSRAGITDEERDTSHEKCVEMSRQILEHCRAMQNSSRPEGQVTAVWTTSYHAVAAACVLGLQLFPNESMQGVRVSREEVEEAQGTLQMLSQRSSIAVRGVELLSRLLQRYDEGHEAEQPRNKRARMGSLAGEELHSYAQNGVDDSRDESGFADPSTFAYHSHAPPQEQGEEGAAAQWTDYNSILSMLDTMPDVYRLFDGTLGQPFNSDYSL